MELTFDYYFSDSDGGGYGGGDQQQSGYGSFPFPFPDGFVSPPRLLIPLLRIIQDSNNPTDLELPTEDSNKVEEEDTCVLVPFSLSVLP